MPRLRRAVWLGLVGVLLLYGGLVLLGIVTAPYFAPPDERSHIDYGMQLTEGSIPLAGQSYPADFPQLGQKGGIQHTSNHPPLYYALAGPLERIGLETGHPRAGLLLARGINALATLVTLMSVAGIAFLVTARAAARTRALVLVAAAAVAAVVPSLIMASSTIENDPLEIALASVTLLVLAYATRNGLSWRLVLLVAGLSALGMLTRISYLPMTALACGAVAYLRLWPDLHLDRPNLPRVVSALGASAVVLVTTVVAAGWFYALNLHRYGDLTGGSAVYGLEAVQQRDPFPGTEHGIVGFLLTPQNWWEQIRQLTGPPTYLLRTVDNRPYEAMGWVFVSVLIIAAVATLVVLLKRGRVAIGDRAAVLIMLALGLLGLASALEMGAHVMHKGGDNNRYLLNGLAFWGVGVALLLVAMRRLIPLSALLLLCIGSAGSVLFSVEIVQLRATGTSWFHTLTLGAEQVGIPAPGLVVCSLLVTAAAGLVLVVASLLRISSTDPA